MKDKAWVIFAVCFAIGVAVLFGVAIRDGAKRDDATKAAWEEKWYADTATDDAISAARRAFGLRGLAWPPNANGDDVNVAVGGDAAFLGGSGGNAVAGAPPDRWSLLEYAAAFVAGKDGVEPPPPIPSYLLRPMSEQFRVERHLNEYRKLTALMKEYRAWFETLEVEKR